MKKLLLVSVSLNVVLALGGLCLLWRELPFAHAGGAATKNGDCDGSGDIDITDAVYLISFLFLGGPDPVKIEAPGTNCPPLNPAADGTTIPQDLVLSEIRPGNFIELYNNTGAALDLKNLPHQFCSPFTYSALRTLAQDVIIPSHGYATVPWPDTFNDLPSGGEVILYRSGNFSNSNDIVDFVCWGTNPHGSRKDQAQSVGKWSGTCAGALTAGSIHRIPGTSGTTAASYNTTSPASPLTCAP